MRELSQHVESTWENPHPALRSIVRPYRLNLPFDLGPFDLAYLDCPWTWRAWSPAGDGRAPPYAREPLAVLKTLPLPDLLAPNAAVAMWVVRTHLAQVFTLTEHWGLTYSSVAFTWVKTTKHGKWHFGMGKVTRANPEQCWLFWHGKGLRIRDHGVPELIVAPLGKHSEKPGEARERLGRLFGRDVRQSNSLPVSERRNGPPGAMNFRQWDRHHECTR